MREYGPDETRPQKLLCTPVAMTTNETEANKRDTPYSEIMGITMGDIGRSLIEGLRSGVKMDQNGTNKNETRNRTQCYNENPAAIPLTFSRKWPAGPVRALCGATVSL